MTNEALQAKIQLVMDKLLHLGGADYENDKSIPLKECLSSSGLFHTILDDPTSYEEVSGTVIL